MLVLVYFVEPPPLKLPPKGASKPKVPVKALGMCYAIGYLFPVAISMWDVGTALKLENQPEFASKFDSATVAAQMSGVLFTCIPMTYVSAVILPKYFTDRRGMFVFLVLAFFASAFMYQWTGGEDEDFTLDLTLYTIGSLLMINALQVGRGFCWALISKLAPLPVKAQAMALNAAIYMLGRGTGSIIAPYVTEDPSDENIYAGIFTGVAFLGILILIANWPILTST